MSERRYTDRDANADRLRSLIAFMELRHTDAAEQLGCTRGALTNLLNGERTPGLALAARIERWTKGQVRAIDWVEVDDE